ncbi:hypothetical protein V1525DRAFT_400470, partial [Lipomyces kononenkoae]
MQIQVCSTKSSCSHLVAVSCHLFPFFGFVYLRVVLGCFFFGFISVMTSFPCVIFARRVALLSRLSSLFLCDQSSINRGGLSDVASSLV